MKIIIKGWCIKSPSGALLAFTFQKDKKQCIKGWNFISNWDEDKINGYSIVKSTQEMEEGWK